MRAIGFHGFGGPEVLEVLDLPEPHAGPGQVRLRVHAATVNPTDTLSRSGRRADLRRDPPPYVPGMDAAGVLDEIGPGTDTDLTLGDAVMAIVAWFGAGGAYAEHVVVPARSAARAPSGADHAAASTLPMNGLTARMALDHLALPPGATLAVTGAAGAVGGYAVQLGKADGLRVIADASPADEALVRSLGADVVVARGDGLAERIRAVVPEGVDGVVDGALLHALVLPAVRDGGGLAAVRAFEGEAERGITLHPVFVRDYAENHDALDRLRQQVEEGVVTLRVGRRFPAAQAADAHRLLEAGGTRGRIVLEL
jgi:NADPH:quinone reductase-like Zn-dependent oxidoreductase